MRNKKLGTILGGAGRHRPGRRAGAGAGVGHQRRRRPGHGHRRARHPERRQRRRLRRRVHRPAERRAVRRRRHHLGAGRHLRPHGEGGQRHAVHRCHRHHRSTAPSSRPGPTCRSWPTSPAARRTWPSTPTTSRAVAAGQRSRGRLPRSQRPHRRHPRERRPRHQRPGPGPGGQRRPADRGLRLHRHPGRRSRPRSCSTSRASPSRPASCCRSSPSGAVPDSSEQNPFQVITNLVDLPTATTPTTAAPTTTMPVGRCRRRHEHQPVVHRLTPPSLRHRRTTPRPLPPGGGRAASRCRSAASISRVGSSGRAASGRAQEVATRRAMSSWPAMTGAPATAASVYSPPGPAWRESTSR